MLAKEFILTHSVDEIKDAFKKIASNHSSKYKNLEFQDSFSMIKIVGTIALGAIVTIELFYESLEDGKTKVKFVYTGSGAKQSINEENEASFDRDFSKMFVKYLTGEVNPSTGKADVPGADGSCLSAIILAVALAGTLYGLYILITV